MVPGHSVQRPAGAVHPKSDVRKQLLLRVCSQRFGGRPEGCIFFYFMKGIFVSAQNGAFGSPAVLILTPK